MIILKQKHYAAALFSIWRLRKQVALFLETHFPNLQVRCLTEPCWGKE